MKYFIFEDHRYEVEHLADISEYNNNYYKLVDMGDAYGTPVTFVLCDTIREICDDDNGYSYEIGFIRNNKFLCCFCFNMEFTDRRIFEEQSL